MEKWTDHSDYYYFRFMVVMLGVISQLLLSSRFSPFLKTDSARFLPLSEA